MVMRTIGAMKPTAVTPHLGCVEAERAGTLRLDLRERGRREKRGDDGA